MARKITVSFKDTEKDNALFDEVMKLDDKSYYIKELLRKELAKEVTEVKKPNGNLLDF